MKEKKNQLIPVASGLIEGEKVDGRGLNVKYTEKEIAKYAKDLIKYALEKIENEEMPFLQEFAMQIGKYSRLFRYLATKSETMREALEMFKDMQVAQISKQSLTNKYNAYFAKFFMINCLGFKPDFNLTPQVNINNSNTQEIVSSMDEKDLDGIINDFIDTDYTDI